MFDRCGLGEKIKIEAAEYGRQTKDICKTANIGSVFGSIFGGGNIKINVPKSNKLCPDNKEASLAKAG